MELKVRPKLQIENKTFSGFSQIKQVLRKMGTDQFLESVATEIAKLVESGKTSLNSRDLYPPDFFTKNELQDAVNGLGGLSAAGQVNIHPYDGDIPLEERVFRGINQSGYTLSMPNSVTRNREYRMEIHGGTGYINFDLPDNHPINIVKTILHGYAKKDDQAGWSNGRNFPLTFTEARDVLLTLFHKQGEEIRKNIGDIIAKKL